MTKEELKALSMRLGKLIEDHLSAEEINAHFILLTIEDVGDGHLGIALTSSSGDPRMIGETLHDYGAEMLQGKAEVSWVEGENERKN